MPYVRKYKGRQDLVGRAVTFGTNETGCKFPTNRKLNKDGYYRINLKKYGRLRMYHQVVWEELNGPIPYGHEINHKCRNRACCNVEHLEVIGISEHKSMTNRQRAGTGYYKAHLRYETMQEM